MGGTHCYPACISSHYLCFFKTRCPGVSSEMTWFLFFCHNCKRKTVIIPQKWKKPRGNRVMWLLFSVVFFVTVQAVWRLTLITLMVLAASLCQDEAAGIWRSSGMPTVGFDPLPSPAVTGPVHVHYHFHFCNLVYWLISSVQSQLKEQKRVYQHREKGRNVFVSPFN